MQIRQKSFKSFTLKSGDVEILLNPDYKYTDSIALYSVKDDANLNYSAEGSSLVIESAGEYESKDIFITGKKVSKSEAISYDISIDELHVGLVDYVQDIDALPIDLFESCDILILGAGGGRMFSPKDAYDVIQKISPKCAIIYGFKEQLGKVKDDTVSDLESAKTHFPGIKLADKNFKISKSDIELSDNTDIYYFEI